MRSRPQFLRSNRPQVTRSQFLSFLISRPQSPTLEVIQTGQTKKLKAPKSPGLGKNSFGYANVLFSSVGQLIKFANEEAKVRKEKRKIPKKPPRPQPFKALGLLSKKASFSMQNQNVSSIKI